MKKIALTVVSLATLCAFPVHAVDAVNGKAVYDKKCAMCHGKDLKGNAAMGKVLKVETAKLSLLGAETLMKTDADLIAVTTNGKDKMPAQKGKVADADIADSIAYLRSVAGASSH